MKRVMYAARSWFPLVSIPVIAILLGIAIYNLKMTAKKNTGQLIANDIAHLTQIFKKINDDCYILKIEGQQNTINFLNVKKDGFVGSQVGPLNLAYPEKWQGPYEKKIFEVQDTQYVLVRTKKGYFITPGIGVKLPNGKIIGKDLKLDENTDIQKLVNSDLSFNGKPLAAQIYIGRETIPPVNEQVLLPQEGA